MYTKTCFTFIFICLRSLSKYTLSIFLSIFSNFNSNNGTSPVELPKHGQSNTNVHVMVFLVKYRNNVSRFTLSIKYVFQYKDKYNKGILTQ